MDTTYENRYVAFLDILGFKNMVLQSENNQQILNLINMALNYTAKIQIENYEQNMPMVDLGKQVSVFSDSIVISYEMIRPGSGFFVLLDLVYICNDLLGVGMPVAGGYLYGSFLDHELWEYSSDGQCRSVGNQQQSCRDSDHYQPCAVGGGYLHGYSSPK